eukprot:6349426-Karenia_brevis.AAC.1
MKRSLRIWSSQTRQVMSKSIDCLRLGMLIPDSCGKVVEKRLENNINSKKWLKEQQRSAKSMKPSLV